MDGLLRDLRHAARNLLRSPGFALITVVTLALGIGANTAIFSVVNAVILRPLGYPQPERLIYISSQFPKMGFDQFWISPPEFLEFQERARKLLGGRRVCDRPGESHGSRSSATREHRDRLGRAVQGARREPDAGARVRRVGNDPERPAGRDAVVRNVAIRVRRQREPRRIAGRDQRHPPHHHRDHAAAFRRGGQPRRSLDAARHQPGQPAESRQPLPESDRPPGSRRDARERECGARHAA